MHGGVILCFCICSGLLLRFLAFSVRLSLFWAEIWSLKSAFVCVCAGLIAFIQGGPRTEPEPDSLAVGAVFQEPEPSEPFFWNRNRNLNHASPINLYRNAEESGFPKRKLRRLFVTCGVFTRYFFVVFSWFFRGFFVALFCLEKQCSGLFRYFFVVFSWFFRGFFVAPVLGKFYAYSPWNSLPKRNCRNRGPEPLERLRPRTGAEPNRGHLAVAVFGIVPLSGGLGKASIISLSSSRSLRERKNT